MTKSEAPGVTHPLVGQWVTHLGYYSTFIYTIAFQGTGFTVHLTDDDGDGFVISEEAWDGEWLTFTWLSEETGRVGYDECRLMPDGMVENLFTYTQRAIRTRRPPTDYRKGEGIWPKGKALRRVCPRNPLVGTWYTDEGEDFRIDYTILQRKSGVTVRARDYWDLENERITRVKWNGQILQFQSERSGRIGRIQVRSLTQETAEFLFTFTDRSIWKKR